MFASLSRGSSKATRSYICSSCLCNIVAAPIPPPICDRPSAARHALFSTTTAAASPKDGKGSAEEAQPTLSKLENSAGPSSSRKSRGSSRMKGRRRGPDSRLVSGSNVTLGALRKTLLAQEEQSKLAEVEAPPRLKKSSKEPKRIDSKSSTDLKVSKGSKKETKETKASKTSKKESKNSKDSKDPSQTTQAEGKPLITRVKTSKSFSRKAVSNRVKAKPEKSNIATSPSEIPGDVGNTSGPRIIKVQSETPKIRRSPNGVNLGRKDDKKRAMQSYEKNTLIEALREGRIPEAQRRELLRSLRNSLLSSTSYYKDSKNTAKLRIKGPASQGLKDAMLRPRPSRFPQPYSQKRIGIEIPYKVGAPRAANRAPIERAAPGPLSRGALAPKFLMGSMTVPNIETVNADDLELTPIDSGSLDVPALAYGLERVLFNPGVYQLQDPRTRVFNFDPYLKTIMPVSQFDFNALKRYITSSKDDNLLSKAAAEKKKYTGSTSSMTSALSHFHFLLSQWRLINVGNLSKMFPVSYHTFTAFQRAPVSVFLRLKDGTYAIDADKQFDSATVLSMLGKSMEKLLTLPTEDFEKYRKGNSDQISEEERNEPEAFHYTTMGDFLMRSQLDAHDSRLPGTGMFDLKTRAVVSIRMDTDAYEEGSGYQIRSRHGEWESFEREYYDMIRSAFLKYSLQVRIGRMDGIFVAFHNTERIFGFQYISLEEMDYALHGTDDKRLGDDEFKLSVDLLNRVLDRATAKYPGKSLRVHFETRDAVTPFMYIFAQPVEESRIEEIQATNRSEIEEFERKVLGLENEQLNEAKKQAQWDEIRARVEESMEQDEHDPEREVEDTEDDMGVMTEEERHQIQLLVSSNTLEEDNHDVDKDHEGLVDEEAEDFEEGTEELVVDELVETDEIVDEEDPEVARPTESEQDIEEVEDSQDGEVERAEGKAAAGDVEEGSTSMEEHEEGEGDSESVESISQPSIEDINADEGIYRVANQGEGFVDEDAPQDSAVPLEDEKGEGGELLAMTLTIRNKIDGEYVAQPDETNFPPGANWEVEYALAEVHDPTRAAALYKACKFRRSRIHNKSIDLAYDTIQDQFLERIKTLSKEGRQWRNAQEKLEAELPVRTLDEKPKQANYRKSNEEITDNGTGETKA